MFFEEVVDDGATLSSLGKTRHNISLRFFQKLLLTGTQILAAS